MATRRLTTMEKRAREMCGYIDRTCSMPMETFSFSIEYARSRTWGHCPRIMWRGEKAAHASGCGYCKTSTVLADALRWLGRTDDEQQAIRATGGAGVSSVERALLEAGWVLRCTYDGKREECYTLTRA